MSRPERTPTGDAHAVWEGDLAGGSGTLREGGLAGETPISWKSRVAGSDDAAATTPETLIAAAHAGCYSMSLAAVLDEAGHRADRLEVRTACRAELGKAGLAIRAIDVDVRGTVPGLAPDEFERLATLAERRCPVSNSLRGNVDIRVTAAFEAAAPG